ncbi:MAG: MFS transporter [Pseudomonadota bacterium]
MSPRLLIFVGLSLTAMGQTVLFAVLGPLVRDFGFSEFAAGVIISASAVTVVAVSPLWGRLSDRVGRKPVFLAGVAGFAVFSGLFGAVLLAGMAGWLTGGVLLGALVLARVVYALAIAGAQPAAGGYIADTSSASDRAGAMALVGGAFAIGSILGPLMAWAFTPLGILFPIFAAAGAGALWAGLIARYMPEPDRTAQGPDTTRLNATDPRVRALLLGVVCIFTAIAMMQQTLAFYVQDLFELDAQATSRRAGLLIGCLAVANLVAFAVVTALKPAPGWLLVLGGAVAALGVAVIAASTALPLLILACVLMGAGFGAFLPGAQSKASLAVGEDQQGAVAGLTAAAMASGYILGPAGGTALYTVSATANFVAAGCLVVLGAVLATRR